MIKRILNLIRNKKREKLMKQKEVPIIIPSLEKFIDRYKSNIRKHTAVHHSASPDNLTAIVERFHVIAVEALIDTLIDVGYIKKKGK